MSGQHRATPEQWAYAADRTGQNHFACILELRARVEALEATQHAHDGRIDALETAHEDAAMNELRAASAEARPGGLVEQVAAANNAPEAIRAVAAWLRTGRLLHAAELLELEADR